MQHFFYISNNRRISTLIYRNSCCCMRAVNNTNAFFYFRIRNYSFNLRSYIDEFQFKVPENCPSARSVIILAIPLKISIINFNLESKIIPVIIPPGYVSFGYTLSDIKKIIIERIIGKESRLELAKIPLKLAAAHSGLAEYGRNNISYITGLGSYYQLLGFYSDTVFEHENWTRVKPLRLCKGCYICLKACPTKCIREKSFLVDIDNCITLYNEIKDPIPGWMDPKVHHALVGCMRCQWDCPANLEHNNNTEIIAEIGKGESRLIVRGIKNAEIEKTINSKLNLFHAAEDLDYLSRNLNLVLANISDQGSMLSR